MRRKKLSDILTDLIDRTMMYTSKITDFTPGSALRSIYEAIALEIEQYYILMKENIKWGIEQGIIESFDFERREPRRAFGEVELKFYNALEKDYIIPRGTTFASTNTYYPQQYETLEDYRIGEGETDARVTVYAKTVGESGNIPEGVLNTMTSPSVRVRSITNPLSINTGTDKESLEDFKERFSDFVETRGRATSKALRYATLKNSDVAGVYIHEEIGKVTIYAHDRNGNLPQSLQMDIEKEIEDYAPSGILLEVSPVEKELLDISVDVYTVGDIGDEEALIRHIESEIRDYLNNMNVDENFILTTLTRIIMNTNDRVIYDVEYKDSLGNIDTAPQQIIRPGEISVDIVQRGV